MITCRKSCSLIAFIETVENIAICEEENHISISIVRSMIAEFTNLKKNLQEDYESLQITLRTLL